jgi:hypothetical protein
LADPTTRGPGGTFVYESVAIGTPGTAFLGGGAAGTGADFILLNNPNNPVAAYTQPLQGDPTTCVGTRFYWAELDAKTVYFVADDAQFCSLDYKGIFMASATSPGTGPLKKVVSDTDKLPREGTLSIPSSFTDFGVDQGSVAFQASDATPTGNAIFTKINGVFSRVIGNGDTLLGGTVNGATLTMSHNEMINDGRIPFRAITSRDQGNFQLVALASPHCAGQITSAVSIKVVPPRVPSEHGHGDATGNGYKLRVNQPGRAGRAGARQPVERRDAH